MRFVVPKTAAIVITAAAAMLAVPAMASAAPMHAAAKHASKVSVSASPRNAVAGTTVKLSATVASANPKPTGSVTFWWTSHKLCVATLAKGSGHCNAKFDKAATYPVRAVYSGDAKHAGATGKVNVVATKASTTTKVSPSTTDTTAGTKITFTAGVSSHGPLVATGWVTFTSGSTTLCSKVGLSHSATAQCRYAFSGVGKHTVTATYGGDVAHLASHGTSGAITVNPAPKAATTTTITGFAPTPVNASTTETVTVTVTSPTGTPTGTVTVEVENIPTIKCTATLSGGTGTCPLTLGAGFGLTPFVATYSGDSSHQTSTGNSSVEVRAPTTTKVAFAAGAVTANVENTTGNNISGSAGGKGTVTFYTGTPGAGTAIAACTDVALSYTKATGNTAMCSAIPGDAGTVYAVYSGDAENEGSTSTAVDVTG